MIYGSVCSGIEAASVAWKSLGWRAAFLSEIEPFPRAVLAHHYAGTPLHGDFTTIQAGQYEPIDLLVGGTPCQSFSVAGLRGGLADERGNLALEFLRLAERLRPRWLVWENVPGVLSSGDGRDFGSFLGGLVQLGHGFAYRVLDAQFFGLAQRRKRVFVVGYLGDWRRAAAVLFEPACLRWNPPPSREAGQGPARCLANGSGSSGQRYDGDSKDFVVAQPVANTLMVPSHGAAWKGDGYDNLVAHALRADGFDASEDGTGRGTPLVPVAWALGSHAGAADGDQTNRSHANGGPVGSGISEGLAHSLRSGRTQAIAFDARQSNVIQYGDQSGPLDTNEHSVAVAWSIMPQNSGRDYKARQVDVAQPVMDGGPIGGNQGGDYIQSAAAVRRLTPEECEALQGFPRGYTDVPHRGKPAADGPRYRALGNSFAVPVVRWIGRRIAAQEAEIRGSQQAAA